MLTAKLRKQMIINKLIDCSEPQKGSSLAKELGVTRQVIVKDIALLRAEGNNIIATPDGYIIERNATNRINRVIAVNHHIDEMEDELATIIRYGGVIEDVVVEHPLYGEIRAMLKIRNFNDLSNFVNKFNNLKATPLSALTGGVHIHTISTETEENMVLILDELKNKRYLITE
jgi:transcriptional regulator of NAD metabolism